MRSKQFDPKLYLPDLVEEFTRLKRQGNRYSGLCPFHDEKTPSFSVNANKGFYKCFGCGVGGDAFSFIMEMRSLSFPEAVRYFGERYGVDVPESGGKEQSSQERDELRQGQAILTFAAGWYHQVYCKSPKADAARQYVQSRGFGNDEVARAQIGWSPDGQALVNRFAEKGIFTCSSVQDGLDLQNRWASIAIVIGVASFFR